MPDDLLLIDTSDSAITILTLDRPGKRNALSIQLMDQLADAVEAAAIDPLRRVIILRGNGPSFCAGLDLNEAGDPSNSSRSAHAAARMLLALAQSPLITIASVHGAAFGGGAGLIAACDTAVAAEDLHIGFPEVHRGLVAALITVLLARQIGQRDLRELILWGKTIDAARAKSLGLVQEIVATNKLEETTASWAMQACQGAPGAITRTKRLLDELGSRPLKADIELALKDHLTARNSAEAAEGIVAFRDKRKPVWPERSIERKE